MEDSTLEMEVCLCWFKLIISANDKDSVDVSRAGAVWTESLGIPVFSAMHGFSAWNFQESQWKLCAQILHIQINSVLLRKQSPNAMSVKAAWTNAIFFQLPKELFCKTWTRFFELRRGFWQRLMQGYCAGGSENTVSWDQLRLWEVHVRSRKACSIGHIMNFWQGNMLYGSDENRLMTPLKKHIQISAQQSSFWGFGV